MTEILSLSKYWAIESHAFYNLQGMIRESQARLSLFSEQPLQNTSLVTIRDGVAIISIHGIITPRQDLFTLLMGGTPLDVLAKELQTALENKDVKAILLDIDSPGGVAIGQSEMADIIYRAREKKPVWAYTGRNCCSAAYWLAAAAEKIIAHKSALVGSIGVVSAVPVQEQPDKDGYKHLEIVSSHAKNKRPDPRTPEGLEEIRRELDSIEQEFISAIAHYRNLTPLDIQENFGKGGVLIGVKAVTANMIDALGSFESTLAALIQEYVTTKTNKGVNKMQNETTIKKELITADFLNRECPEIFEAIKKQGVEAGKEVGFKEGKAAGLAEGAEKERSRLNAIDKIAMPGHENIVNAAKENSDMTAEKLALQIIEAEKSRGQSYIASLRAAENNMPDITPSAITPTSENMQTTGATPQERAENEWKNTPQIRTEFNGDKEAFKAFYIANEAGLVKLQSK